MLLNPDAIVADQVLITFYFILQYGSDPPQKDKNIYNNIYIHSYKHKNIHILRIFYSTWLINLKKEKYESVLAFLVRR